MTKQIVMLVGVVATVGMSRPTLPTQVPASVRKGDIDVQSQFTPSGLMGDGEYARKYVEFSGADASGPHTPPSAIKVTYSFGQMRWAGQYWQNEPDNWGDKPGTNYSGRKFTKLVFWAKGETGRETVEFKAGGIDTKGKKYRDSFMASRGRVQLSQTWTQYEIDLSGMNLSSVIGAFCWVANADYNPSDKRITFYIDDIVMQ
jgi:hypothetical protein